MIGEQGPDTRPRRADTAGPACCRCGGTGRLIRDDGPVVCWGCAFAWGSFAALVTGGPVAREPVMVGACRIGHRRPRADCVWCAGRERPDRAGLGFVDYERRGPSN